LWYNAENGIGGGGMEHRDMVFDIEKDPYNYVMRVVFGRWKPFILQAMNTDQVTNFSRFCKQLPISQKVLTENLKALEQDGLIYRTVIPDTPPRTEYRLTPRGQSLIPLLDAVYAWGWNVMQAENMPIDALGEMWHGYREKEDDLMYHPFQHKKRELP
jgi:DNA-binding HxlR family transcriptional regulator